MLWGAPGTRQTEIRVVVSGYPHLDLTSNAEYDFHSIPLYPPQDLGRAGRLSLRESDFGRVYRRPRMPDRSKIHRVDTGSPASRQRDGWTVGSEGIRQAIEAATEYLRQHPEDARSTDSAATASLVDGLVVRVAGPGGATIVTDMVPSVGGTATAPSPGWLLRAAEASCVATLVAMRAAMLAITLDTLEVTVDSESDDRGILGLDDAVPAGPLSGRVTVRLVAGGVEPATLEEIARWGVRHCPVCDALERPVSIATEVITD